MARTTGMAPAQRRALDRLKQVPGIARFHLAGDTAVAFHLNHRRSQDLDLFGPSRAPFAPFQKLAKDAPEQVQIVRVGEATLQFELFGVPVDVVRFPHALLEPPTPGPGRFPVAGLLDLATNKLAAISKRGLRRDFWDLYAILQSGISLRTACGAYVQRFGVAETDLYHVLVGLTWFDDAEADPVLPSGMNTRLWRSIRRYFEHGVPGIAGLTRG